MQNDKFSQKMQLIEAQKDLTQLQHSNLVPPLMLAKLNFLAEIIEQRTVNESLVELLPYYERQALQELKPQVQIAIFISIVNCLAGKEIITYCRRERAYLRKEKGFFGWKKCYIDCDTHHVSLFQSRSADVPFQQFDIAQLWVSRYYKYYKKKTILGVYHGNHKFVLGFDQEISCKRVHSILTSLVSDNREWKCTTFTPLSREKQEGSFRFGPESRKVEQAIISEQSQYLNNLQGKIARLNIPEQGFKLFKNTEFGRILVNEAKGAVRASIIVRDVSELTLLQDYILQKWNSNVQRMTILGKPRTNSYLAYLKTNKYSFMSYPRDSYLSISYSQACSCRTDPIFEGNSYLLVESVTNHNDPPAAGVVHMDLKQLVQLSKSSQDATQLLMTLTIIGDFKGYASVQDNITMTLHLLGNLTEFIAHATKNKRQTMFQKIPCLCKRDDRRRSSRVISDFSLPTQQNVSNDDQQSDKGNQRNAFRKMSLKTNQSEMILMIEALVKGVKNDAILELMRSKKHESYALNHHFSQQDETFQKDQNQNRDFLLQGKRWELKGDEYSFINEQALAAQKDILKMIIKQLGSNLVSGKSVMNMSLPVEIFDKRSMLDVIADTLGFLPHYLTRAAKESNPVERMKLVACAFMFISATCPNIEKPFNPILGQTYQGQIANFTVSLEQISHHPPVSAIYMRSKQVEFYGNFDITVDMGLNTAYSKVNNWFNLNILSNNSQYKIKIPDIQLGGLMYGSRTLKFSQRGYVYQKNSELFCQMNIGKTKKRIYERQKMAAADLAGGIFRVRPQFGVKVLQQTGKKSFDGLKPQDVLESCCFLSGKWYGNISFDGVSYKSITDGPFPEKCRKLKYLLPSDSLFREDVIFKIWKDNAGSNREKQRLENIQRADRKLRQKMAKK